MYTGVFEITISILTVALSYLTRELEDPEEIIITFI